MTGPVQREYLEQTGSLHLLNYCAALRSRYAPRNPHKLLLGLLKRDGGLVLTREELQDFVKTGDAVHPPLLFNTLMLSLPADASFRSEAWCNIAQLSASLFCKLCTVDELQAFVAKQDQASTPAPPLCRLVLQLAISKHAALSVPIGCSVKIVVALSSAADSYTMLTHDGMLQEQVQQLRWLFAGTKVSWQVIYADAEPSGCIATAAERMVTEGIQRGDEELSTLVDVLHVRCSTPPPDAACTQIRCFKGCLENIRAQRRHCDVVLVGASEVSVHLGLVGSVLYELHNGKEIVLCDPAHPQSCPKAVLSVEDRLFAFMWQKILLPVILPTPVPRDSPLAGLTYEALMGLNMQTENPSLFFAECVVRVGRREGKKASMSMISTLPVMSTRVATAAAEKSVDYPALYQAMCVLADKIFGEQKLAGLLDSESVGWLDFFRDVQPDQWGTLFNSSPVALLLQGCKVAVQELQCILLLTQEDTPISADAAETP